MQKISFKNIKTSWLLNSYKSMHRQQKWVIWEWQPKRRTTRKQKWSQTLKTLSINSVNRIKFLNLLANCPLPAKISLVRQKFVIKRPPNVLQPFRILLAWKTSREIGLQRRYRPYFVRFLNREERVRPASLCKILKRQLKANQERAFMTLSSLWIQFERNRLWRRWVTSSRPSAKNCWPSCTRNRFGDCKVKSKTTWWCNRWSWRRDSSKRESNICNRGCKTSKTFNQYELNKLDT